MAMNDKEKCNLAGNALLFMMGGSKCAGQQEEVSILRKGFHPVAQLGMLANDLRLQRKFEKRIRSLGRGGRIGFCG